MLLNDVVSEKAFTTVPEFALAEPPSWTRLEPQSVTGDPSPGLEARVHDPLWLLVRQWQLGEFAGEDAGRPISVRVGSTTCAVSRWQAGAWDDVGHPPQAAQDYVVRESRVTAAGNEVTTRLGELLEPLVEREPATAAGPGVRARAEAGAAFLAVLDDAGLSSFKDAVVAQCPLDADPPDPSDPSLARLLLVLGGRMPDGERLCAALEAAAGLPAWLTPGNPADRAALLAAVGAWTAWYRAEVSPPAEAAPDSWIDGRLEYRFSLAARASAGEIVLRAPECRGGSLDWHSFDLDASRNATLGTPADAPVAAQDQVLLATPLVFPGMPADRLWEFEDAQVSLGALEAEPHDLARLLLVEFATIYGSDWLVVPLDVPHGSLTTIGRVTYLNTFGERFVVRPTSTARPGDPWRMFVISGPGNASLNGLFVPPAAVQSAEGRALEEVLFVRDEMADMAWGVERVVSGPSGDPRLRRDEPRSDVGRPNAPPVPTAELDYVLETVVPPQWIPYIPRTDAYRSIELVRGALVRFSDGVGAPVVPVGRLLNESSTRRLFDAEVPREGVRVTRVPVVARRADGSYVRWIARRVGVGRGEGSSGLAFDSAVARKPPL
jgi:hypothetical protein